MLLLEVYNNKKFLNAETEHKYILHELDEMNSLISHIDVNDIKLNAMFEAYSEIQRRLSECFNLIENIDNNFDERYSTHVQNMKMLRMCENIKEFLFKRDLVQNDREFLKELVSTFNDRLKECL